jgi:hypothetical protein
MHGAATLALCCFAASHVHAADLQPETVRAFEKYIRETEIRLDQRLPSKFLWLDDDAQRATQVRAGQVAIENRGGHGMLPVPGGLIHDWIGAAFIRGATIDQTLALVQNYDRHQQIYQPEVLRSRLLSRNGNDFRVYMRLLKKKIVTVVLDTEHDVHYERIDASRWRSRSHSTRITELENPGKPSERALPAGDDHGFLWRLNSYWRFEQRDGGVYVECEAISLTRGIPAGLGWLVEPIIKSLPRESLANTLRETRTALAAPSSPVN